MASSSPVALFGVLLLALAGEPTAQALRASLLPCSICCGTPGGYAGGGWDQGHPRILTAGTAAAARMSAAALMVGGQHGRSLAQIPGLQAATGPAGQQRVVYLNVLTCNGTALDPKNQSTLTCHNGTAERTAAGARAKGGRKPWTAAGA